MVKKRPPIPRVDDDPHVRATAAALGTLHRAEHADRERAMAVDVELATRRRRAHQPEDLAPLAREAAEIAARREARRPSLRDAERASASARDTATSRIVAQHVVPGARELVAQITPATSVEVQRGIHALLRAAADSGALTPFMPRVRARVDAVVTALGQLTEALNDPSVRQTGPAA
jgi:hypothetical protein